MYKIIFYYLSIIVTTIILTINATNKFFNKFSITAIINIILLCYII